MAEPDDIIADITRMFFHMMIVKYVAVVSLTIVVYDYFLTFWEEVAFVWSSRWTIPKILFVINRYLAFTDPVLLVYVLSFGSTPKACVRTFHTLAWCSTMGITVAQVILVARTIAIWERKPYITVSLSAMLVVAIGLDLFLAERYIRGIGSLPTPTGYRGCLYSYDSRIIFINFFTIMTTESVVLALLVLKALEQFRHGRSTLMVTMYRDGIFYFCFILATSIANAVTLRIAPIEMNNFLIVLQRVLHSVLCNRVLLHIRGATRGIDEDEFVVVKSLPQTVPLSPASPTSPTRGYHVYPPQKREAYAAARVNW